MSPTHRRDITTSLAPTRRSRARTGGAVAGIALVGLGACSTDADPSAEPTGSTQSAEPATPSEATGESTTDPASGDYADGTYAASGSYTSPGGQEAIEVEVTLEAGVITSVSVDNSTTSNPNSLRYQTEFINGIEAEVVGVPINELSVDRVGGSSLTSGGFNNAIETIKDEAVS